MDDMNLETIGSVVLGIDGIDQYVLIRCPEDCDKTGVRDWLLERCYRDSSRPGGYFCTSVTVIPHTHVNTFIGIIHHRYDV